MKGHEAVKVRVIDEIDASVMLISSSFFFVQDHFVDLAFKVARHACFPGVGVGLFVQSFLA